MQPIITSCGEDEADTKKATTKCSMCHASSDTGVAVLKQT